MKKVLSFSLITMFILIIQGCGVSKSYMYEEKNVNKEKNKDIKISLKAAEPTMIAGYSALVLQIENNTNKDIKINWNKTYFIDNGSSNGTFMFAGIVYKDRNNAKPDDIVFAQSRFSKRIYPNNYVVFNSGRYASWGHNGFGTGEFGVYLNLNMDNKEFNKKVFIKVKEK